MNGVFGTLFAAGVYFRSALRFIVCSWCFGRAVPPHELMFQKTSSCSVGIGGFVHGILEVHGEGFLVEGVLRDAINETAILLFIHVINR